MMKADTPHLPIATLTVGRVRHDRAGSKRERHVVVLIAGVGDDTVNVNAEPGRAFAFAFLGDGKAPAVWRVHPQLSPAAVSQPVDYESRAHADRLRPDGDDGEYARYTSPIRERDRAVTTPTMPPKAASSAATSHVEPQHGRSSVSRPYQHALD
jgi:hypothetical protein